MGSIELATIAITQFGFATDRGKETPIHQQKALSAPLVAAPHLGPRWEFATRAQNSGVQCR
jgi:hypothetical protein